MDTGLIRRFGTWLGLWRGLCELEDGRSGIAEFSIIPFFGGQLIEVSGASLDATSGDSLFWGVSHLVLCGKGRAVWSHFNERNGFTTLREVDDDPDVLMVQGLVDGDSTMTVCWQFAGDELVLTVSVAGAAGRSAPPRRSTCRLKRIGHRLGDYQP